MKELEEAIAAAKRLECMSVHYLNHLPLMSKTQISHLFNDVLLNAINKPLHLIDDVITVLSFINNFKRIES